MTSALKDNIYLEKAMITGILRVAKESVFSGLNNLQVNTILGLKFKDKFGFTEEELKELLTYYDLQDKSENIKKWYNGYVFGGKTIYNPWSVLNYIDNNEMGFMPYWINSSSNDLIKKLLLKGDTNMKLELEELIAGNSISKAIDDFLSYTIEEGTAKALKQIEDNKYETELLEKGIKNIVKLAIVFKGKEIKVTEGK